jgi:signal transduction histidine kinase
MIASLDVTDLEKVELRLRSVDLVALTRAVLARSTSLIAQAGCTIELRAPDSVIGRWDSDRLERILTNLLSNAIKFGPGKPIAISINEGDGNAQLVMVDHGIGITPEAMPHIFDKFERAVSAHSYGGLGLGLYIVRKLVHALSGTVRAESVPGVETRFIVELPR